MFQGVKFRTVTKFCRPVKGFTQGSKKQEKRGIPKLWRFLCKSVGSLFRFFCITKKTVYLWRLNEKSFSDLSMMNNVDIFIALQIKKNKTVKSEN